MNTIVLQPAQKTNYRTSSRVTIGNMYVEHTVEFDFQDDAWAESVVSGGAKVIDSQEGNYLNFAGSSHFESLMQAKDLNCFNLVEILCEKYNIDCNRITFGSDYYYDFDEKKFVEAVLKELSA